MEKTLAKIASMNFVSEKPRYRTHEKIGIILNQIAAKHPREAQLKTIGYSLEARPVYCLELGNANASNRILWVANAHGEEMRGTEELLHIIRALVSDNFLRETFLTNFHFTIIPTINPDAREYNLRWAKDEIDLREYFLSARRHIDNKDGSTTDIEWGYPLDESDMRTMRRPEAAALKQLMDNQKFDLYLDLHGALNVCNLGFWFLVGSGKRNRNQTIDFLYTSGLRSGLPLTEREKLEGDLCLKIKPGVHTLCTSKEILAKYAKEPKLISWFKKELGASSFDYLLLKNSEAQCFVSELPTFYHERYMDMTPSNRLRADVRRYQLEKSLKRIKEKFITILEEALMICEHPILKKRREGIDNVSLPSIKNDMGRLEDEHGNSIATLGEIRELEDLSDYWQCPTYGRYGMAGLISRLPREEQVKLEHIYQRCVTEAEKCVDKVKATELRELTFADSVNIQARTCLGLILTYFS